MPKLGGMSLDEVNKTLHGFQYSNISIDKLCQNATEYTIAHMVVDQTGSVSSFKAALEGVLKVSVDACKKSPRANNLLYRTTAFNSQFVGVPNVRELHGFTLVDQVDPAVLTLSPNGGTPLCDATLEAVDAIYSLGIDLYKKKLLCNGILFVATDGEENASTKADPAMIKKMIEKIRAESILESFRSILIGVNDTDPGLKAKLEAYQRDSGIDEYISIGEATAGKLAKLAQFVSQSVSSQSQALGSGGASQPISFKF